MRRWNWIDWGILLLALCLLAGGGWLVWQKPWQRDTGEVLVCTLVTAPVSAGVLPEERYPATGATVRSASGGEPLGEVLAVTVQPDRVLSLADGALRFSDAPERLTAEVTVRLTLTDRKLGGKRVGAGSRVDLIIGDLLADGCELLALEPEAEDEE